MSALTQLTLNRVELDISAKQVRHTANFVLKGLSVQMESTRIHVLGIPTHMQVKKSVMTVQ